MKTHVAGKGSGTRRGGSQTLQGHSGQAPALRAAWLLVCLAMLLGAFPLSTFAQEHTTPERRVIIVGGDENFPPYEFLDEHGKPAGYNVELTRAIAQAMGLEVELALLPRGELPEALRSGRIDAIQGLLHTREREKHFDFSRPYATVSHAIFVRRGGRQIESIDDLRGKDIIVARNSAMQDFVLEKGLSEALVLVDSPSEALKLLSAGKHDCALLARLPGLGIARTLGLSNVVIDGPPIGPSDYCYAVRKGDASLLASLSEGLGIVCTSGVHDEIYRRWFEVAEPGRLPLGAVLKYAGITVLVSLFIFFAAAWVLWTRSLNRLVAQRTRELEAQIAQRVEAEKEIERLARIPGESPNPIFRVSREGTVLYANPPGEALLGRLGCHVGVPLTGKLAREVADIFAAGANREIDVASDGRIFSFFCALVPEVCTLIPEEGYVNLYGRDVTEHRAAEEAVRRANRAYQVLSDSNQALVRISDESVLLKDVCRILCEVGGYRFAWVGFAEEDARKTVRPVAWSGYEDGYLEKADITWADAERGGGPTGRAIRTGRQVICRNIPTDPAFAAWREDAMKRGYASSIALPLTTEGRTFGALNIYAVEPDRFDAEEVRLLSELANDITYGIMTLRARRKLDGAMEELKEREERFRSTFEQAAVGIAHVACDGRFLRINRRFCDLLGYSREEMLERTFQDITHADDLSKDLDHIRQLLAGDIQTYSREKRYIRKDGAAIWVNLTVSLVRESSGEPNYRISVVEDISRRKAAETALAESHEKFQSIVENLDIGVSLIGREMEIVELNRQMRRWFPAARPGAGVICYRTFNDPPREVPCDYCPVVKTFADGEVHEAISDRPAGTRVIHYRVVSSPVRDAGGQLIGAIELVEDITERVALEEQMRETAKLESIGRLAGGVAHDFNNLLTGILGYAQLLLTQVRGQEALENDLTQIRELANRAADLTRQLLAFSRRQPIQPVVFNLNSLVADATKMLKRLIGEDVELVFRGAGDLGNVRADPGQIEQILMNLAVNARDAMPEGGRLTVETANVVLDRDYASHHFGVTPGPHVMLAMSDTGCGMDEATRERIFEPFFTTKEKGKGTGLGLSTVYGIVKQHGGSIYVYSELNKGTTFKVYFPRVDAPAEELRRKEREAPPGGAETILVVEDEAAVRALVERILTERGYRVLACGSPRETQAILASHPGEVNLLLTDVVLPGESGKELYRRLVAQRPSLRVLYMSGYTDNAIVHHGVLESGAPFIQKPFAPDSLAGKVREVLDAQEHTKGSSP